MPVIWGIGLVAGWCWGGYKYGKSRGQSGCRWEWVEVTWVSWVGVQVAGWGCEVLLWGLRMYFVYLARDILRKWLIMGPSAVLRRTVWSTDPEGTGRGRNLIKYSTDSTSLRRKEDERPVGVRFANFYVSPLKRWEVATRPRKWPQDIKKRKEKKRSTFGTHICKWVDDCGECIQRVPLTSVKCFPDSLFLSSKILRNWNAILETYQLKPRSKKREHNQFFLWHLFIYLFRICCRGISCIQLSCIHAIALGVSES